MRRSRAFFTTAPISVLFFSIPRDRENTGWTFYNTSGQVETTLYFEMDYKDIILRGDNIIIYNETQCLLANRNGVERFNGDFERPCLLFAPLSGNRYLAFLRTASIPWK